MKKTFFFAIALLFSMQLFALPTVVTGTATDMTKNTAVLNGTATQETQPILTVGFEWRLQSTTTWNDAVATGTGPTVTATISGLTAGTVYEFRAFATTSAGRTRGATVTFTTVQDFIGDPMFDIDGNEYPTVRIGNQIWMAENLKTIRYDTESERPGQTIPVGNWSGNPFQPLKNAFYVDGRQANTPPYSFNLTPAIRTKLGLLYNWSAAVGVANDDDQVAPFTERRQGICPNGWLLPTYEDFNILNKFLATNTGLQIRTVDGWYTSEHTFPGTNSWGFSAYPAGNGTASTNESGGVGTSARFYYIGRYAGFWTDSSANGFAAYNWQTMSEGTSFDGTTAWKASALSIRCIKKVDNNVVLPTVKTDSITNITQTSVTLYGTVVLGDEAVTEKGFQWKLFTVDTWTTTVATGSDLRVTLTGLSNNTIYNVRPYAKTSSGTTVYGDFSSFRTLADAAEGTVIDNQGNVYPTITIGSQTWIAQNLRTTRYDTESERPLVSIVEGNRAIALAYYVDGSQVNSTPYSDNLTPEHRTKLGYLYNWAAAVGEESPTSITEEYPKRRQGICPNGWHIPNNGEWTTLINYLGENAGLKARTVDGWNSTPLSWNGNRPLIPGTNESGFSALPAGEGWSNNQTLDPIDIYVGIGTNFWSSTPNTSANAFTTHLNYDSPDFILSSQYIMKRYAYSVRCLKTVIIAMVPPTVNPVGITSITSASVALDGSFIEGTESILSRGFEWKLSSTDTWTVINVPGVSTEFSRNLIGLQATTSYDVRIFVRTISDTTYGPTVSFTTLQTPPIGIPCDGTPTVTDINGNVYNTVQIGNRCWTKENLKALTFDTESEFAGHTIPLVTTRFQYTPTATDISQATSDFSENLTPEHRANFGLLYNWAAAVGVANSNASSGNTSGVTSGRQGICPNGWHLPSAEEFNYLNALLGADVAGTKMKTTTGWTEQAPPGNGTNMSGFSALPAGFFEYQPNGFVGYQAWFWTSKFNGPNNVATACFVLSGYEDLTFFDNTAMYDRASIRCIKNIKPDTIIASADLGGMIFPVGKITVENGGTQPFTVVADPGYEISQVLINGVNNPTVVANGKYTFTNVNGNQTIKATFQKIITQLPKFTVTITPPINGIITVMDGNIPVETGAVLDSGTVLRLSAIPAEGYEFVRWWNNSTNPMRNHTLMEDVTISAVFREIGTTYTVTITPPTNGTITVMNGSIPVTSGTALPANTVLSLTATPAEGFEFEKWWDNHTSPTRSISLTKNETISAEFKLKEVSIVEIIEKKLMVYPNPVTDVLNIQTDEVIKQIVVLDLNGRVVKQLSGNHKTVNLQTLPAGNYIVRIHTETIIIPVKIIKR
jgi:uncharacterized protein (TIGR02145 family)